VQVQSDEVLPDECGEPERPGVGEGHRAGNQQGRHQTSRNESEQGVVKQRHERHGFFTRAVRNFED
jgi:hypothetical protein